MLIFSACDELLDRKPFVLTSEEKQFIPYQMEDEVTMVSSNNDTVTLSVIRNEIDTLSTYSIIIPHEYERKNVILAGDDYRISISVDKLSDQFNFEAYFSKEFSGEK